MAAGNYPITLEQVVFTRSIVVAVLGHNPEQLKVAPPPANSISINKLDDVGRKFQVSMRCLMNENGDVSYPYFIDMECHAILNVDDTLTEEEAHRGAMINGHSVCYGAIREAVGWITGRQIYGQLMLGLSVLTGKPPEAEPEQTTE
ncbi:MAG: hypothetical protein IV101_13565 [Dechloromonas sp.]|uniref:hypothetical protein n=1 Tax=Dechloromonas sp. TaxID=1917218 RepID=UPI0027F7BEFE|nr:hypothetical protein [Dechloromonas sp.]MBT9521907.1 hypothetical protein [Dechloromonas sp.]